MTHVSENLVNDPRVASTLATPLHYTDILDHPSMVSLCQAWGGQWEALSMAHRRLVAAQLLAQVALDELGLAGDPLEELAFCVQFPLNREALIQHFYDLDENLDAIQCLAMVKELQRDPAKF
ncbi:MAG: hypothetical protein AAGF93_08930 [Cyanobacteria bacterium P01_H01_bin.105]